MSEKLNFEELADRFAKALLGYTSFTTDETDEEGWFEYVGDDASDAVDYLLERGLIEEHKKYNWYKWIERQS